MKNKKILTAGVFYIAANIFERAIEFFLLPLFTSLLSTSDYGISSTYFSYVNIISILISLSLGNSIRSAFVDYRDKLDSYISSVVFLQFLVSIATSAVILAVAFIMIDGSFFFLTFFCLIQSFGGCIISMFVLRYTLEVKYVKRTILSIIPNLSAIFLSLVLIYLSPNEPYLGRIMGSFIVILTTSLLLTVLLFARGKRLVSKEYWTYALRYSLPLVFHGLSLVILNQMDRTMITGLRSESETGIYSVAYNFGTIALAFTGALENLWIPWFYRKMNEGDHDAIKRYSLLYSFTASLLSCGVILLGTDVIQWMTNKSYWDAIYIAPLLVASNFFMAICVFPINAMYYKKTTKMIAISSLLSALLNLGLNFWLIPLHGALGAAAATLISHVFMFSLQEMGCKQSSPGLFNLSRFFIPAACIAIIAVENYLLIDNLPVRWLSAAGLTLCFVAFGIHSYDFLDYLPFRKKNKRIMRERI